MAPLGTAAVALVLLFRVAVAVLLAGNAAFLSRAACLAAAAAARAATPWRF